MKNMRDSTRAKRDFVIHTALRLFIEQGYENVSVDEIIKETGTSKGTFYHYFRGKEEIVAEVGRLQSDVVQQWLKRKPAQVKSLEEHINRLFLDLSSNISPYPKLIRSYMALCLQNEKLNKTYRDQNEQLFHAVMRWLPDPQKASLILSTYSGIVAKWCLTEGKDDLEQMIRSEFAQLWAGLRSKEYVGPLDLHRNPKEDSTMKIAIIGGGLAGLTVGAYVSEWPGAEGVLFERSPQLGGRAFTYEKSGFTLNYGAHAIYGIDRHTITELEKELGLSFSSKQVDKRKVMYEKHDRITPAPLDFINIMKTEVLSASQKMRFVGEIAAIIANIHNMKHYPTLGDFLAESNAGEDLKELWEHLVCSNFFIAPEDARKVPGHVISEYYHNLFLSSRPVNYILGSWAVITNQLKEKIELSGRWEICLQEGVDSLRFEDGRFVLKTKNRETAFDRVIFAMPVQQAYKLLRGTPWEPFLASYAGNTPTEVMVYDVGLNRVVARPFSYISDMNNKLFISDVSATDHTLVPPGGQLLQGIAYLNDDFDSEEDRKEYLERRTKQMEQLFDRHYPGWRDAIAVKRVSKKAMVSSVKNIVTNKLLPNRIENVPFYFCGDGCVGKGELAERAFSSARNVAKLIQKELTQPVGV
jgi:protoporphyrinogen oxidase/AcrR family transcriptional regulator